MTAQMKADEGPRAEQALASAEERSMSPLIPSWPEPRTKTIPQFLEEGDTSSKLPLIGVLLIHGLNGNPSDLAELATFLQEQGLITTTMHLPGHGEHGCEREPVSWQEWATAARAEVTRLKERCSFVFVLGHSLGGTLALYVAAQEEVAGVVAICSPLLQDLWLCPVVSLLTYLMPMVPTLHADVCDPQARRRCGELYRWAPTKTMESALQLCRHVRAALPQVTAPALLLSALQDHVVPVSDALAIYYLLGSRTKHLVIFSRSAHVLFKDYEQEDAFAQTAAFIGHQAHRAIAERKRQVERNKGTKVVTEMKMANEQGRTLSVAEKSGTASLGGG
jgi:carboxylesterase